MKPRSDVAILLATILLGSISEVHSTGGLGIFLFAALLTASLVTKSWKILGCTLIFFVMQIYWLVVPGLLKKVPVLGFLIPFAVTWILLKSIPPAKSTLGWMRRGRCDRVSVVLIFLTVILSAGALLIWASWTHNLGVGAQFIKEAGSIPRWLMIVVFIPLFALLNALAEEFVYRGLIQESLTQVFRNPLFILFLQAATFAAVHYSQGFPNGAVGYIMAFGYAVMLGYLRMRTGGILASYLAHVCADATIGGTLIYLVK